MGVKPSEPITADHMDQARERLILDRATHLDSLAAKRYEDRVQQVLGPLLAGEQPATDPTYNDSVAYVRDLGLIAPKDPVTIANPIYNEVIARVLSAQPQSLVTDDPRD